MSARSVVCDLDAMLADPEEIRAEAETATVAGLGGGYPPDVGAVLRRRGRIASGHEHTLDEAELGLGSRDEVRAAVAA
ncbi:MAG TPA: hypothetical protein VG073_00410 [Gaiellaceae bacterium]|nr:hypothetical protein [Gaiellaceae bacterium]